MRETVWRLVRYVFVGGTAAIAHFLAAALLIRLEVPIAIAGAVGFAVGFFVSLVGHRSFTFRSTRAFEEVTVRMALLAAMGAAYNAIASPLAAQAGLSEDVAIAVAVLTTPLLNYALMRFWIFSPSEDTR